MEGGMKEEIEKKKSDNISILNFRISRFNGT